MMNEFKKWYHSGPTPKVIVFIGMLVGLNVMINMGGAVMWIGYAIFVAWIGHSILGLYRNHK